MGNHEKYYCRFCAVNKNSDKLINLDTNKEKQDEIVIKLDFFNAAYISFNSESMLPKTICFSCNDALNNAYEFFQKVKEAQNCLSNVFDQHKNDINSADEDRSYDDYLVQIESYQDINIAVENSSITQQTEVDTPQEIRIKQELKEEAVELGETTFLHLNSDTNNIGDSLNVEDIINCTVNSTYPSNVRIYAKEITKSKDKKVSCWKEYPWICIYCNIEFKDIKVLRKHSKMVHKKCVPFMCYDCKDFGGIKKIGDDINYFNKFIEHVKTHRDDLRLCCHYCDEQLNSIESLNTHLKRHTEKRQPCSACGQLLSEEKLSKHCQEYKNVKPKRRKRGAPITVDDLTCQFCKKVYKNLNSLREHMRRHSDRAKDFTCDRCGNTFYTKGSLTSHIMAHDKIRPYICKICNSSFPFPNILRRHVQVHSNVKPFSCEQCGKCFRLKYQLKLHQIVHTDSFPYVCQYCSKGFRFKQILKNHERQHTGAKPYSCTQCSMDFTNWSNYNKHMKGRHNMDKAKKKITPEGVFPINPETGQIIQIENPVETEEWKSKIMIPVKRGKKKIKKEK